MPRKPVPSLLFDPMGPYSHAVSVGEHIFVSGTPGIDPLTGLLAGEAAYDQSLQAIKNIIACVEAAGGTQADVVSVQVNLVHVGDFAEMNRAFAELFTQPYPARTVIGVAALPKAGARLTLNAVAVLSTP